MISLNKVGVKMIKRFICFLLLIAPCNFVFSETKLPDGSIIDCPISENLFNGQGSQRWQTETLIQEHLKMVYTAAKENILAQVLFMKECLKKY